MLRALRSAQRLCILTGAGASGHRFFSDDRGGVFYDLTLAATSSAIGVAAFNGMAISE
jgi:hypothetical protein